MVDLKELHRNSTSDNVSDRRDAVNQIRVNFSGIPDKDQAWSDLHRLTTDQDSSVRGCVANTIGGVFSQIADKDQAWSDLHRLTNDQDSFVRGYVANAIGGVFSQIADKDQAWSDLHRLTTDQDSSVRGCIAEAVGWAFSQIGDKDQAWSDLYRLTTDEDRDIRVSANHSLGKASIVRATCVENDENFRNELKNALEFFERSAAGATYYKPSEFCLPFYRSFYILTFKKQDAEAEVQTYMAEAKRASEGSQSKEKLLDIIENLANALNEAQNMREMDLNAKKCHLNACRIYCDRAAKLLADTRCEAPVATKLIEKGLPIIDHRIRETIAEIREKTKVVCQQALNTPIEELGKEIAKQGNALCQVGDLKQLEKAITNFEITLLTLVKDPEICDLIERARAEPNVEDKLTLFN